MANQEHLDILKQGVKVWNQWREAHPDIQPDLSEASLDGLWLKDINLRQADLRSTYLSKAILIGADLRGATLVGANLYDADLSFRVSRMEILCMIHITQLSAARAIIYIIPFRLHRHLLSGR